MDVLFYYFRDFVPPSFYFPFVTWAFSLQKLKVRKATSFVAVYALNIKRSETLCQLKPSYNPLLGKGIYF